ncbi:5'-adenylylsulfate reductase-like 3 [Amborella trichopoda]|uniref:Thioredoxin domain-containing protein n=1 Tax=Amborella trichopoda TaxID=13333 RepID=U5CZU8_AMBTC|nr:5'-adenylylsulfate reductase-like 3 [Amborella trichopoda]ERN14652.1 hypothetical protein AMTR_s00038p00202780 [Amborella trichopoda]|eukprot:XP_006853185.1 5'-adenylylsulfate reductase-like 3 [Amborella trichopoda]
MADRILRMGPILAFILSTLLLVVPLQAQSICPIISITDFILRRSDICYTLDSICPIASRVEVPTVAVVNEISLERALNLIHKNSEKYVAILFYASWCPFSKICKTSFAILPSLFPTIHHFAVEESTIKPSSLSKYGVRGFPTLFLQNATTRVRYRGARNVRAFARFYKSTTGINPISPNYFEQKQMESLLLSLSRLGDDEAEHCPFSWARYPEKLVRQETYLALACSFLLVRLLYFVSPTLIVQARRLWRQRSKP